MSILAIVRQLKFPREFRILPVNFPEDIATKLEQLTELLLTEQIKLGNENSTTSSENSTESNAITKQTKFFTDIITHLWRLRQKMTHADSGQPLEGMSRAYRHVESVWDALVQEGIEIKDHTKTFFDLGMPVKVVAYQPTPGLNREMIIETVKPTIFNGDTRIQMGEVIVGTPLTQ